MLAALSAALIVGAEESTPTPVVDPDLVSPGPWGFVIIALVAFAVVFLVWDMLRRIRRGRYRAEIREQLDAEQAASGADEDPTREG